MWMRLRMGEERLTGLALLNTHRDIRIDVEKIIDRCAADVIIYLMDYFGDTYLNNDACMFDRKIWNYFNNENTRTINHLEGSHASLNRPISRPKPNIFVLINELKNQQQHFELDIVAQKNGNPKPLHKMKLKKD